jgi:RNA polymerase sigma factor (sigma-70 family)
MMEAENFDHLAEGMKRGEETAFVDFVRAFETRLYRMFILMGSSQADAEDLAVSSLSLAATRIDRYTPGRDAGLMRWVFTLARNTFMDSRRDRRQQLAGAFTVDPYREPAFVALDADDAPELESKLTRAVDQALRQLSETDREIVCSRFSKLRVPFRDLAARFGLSEEAARKRHERAMGRLEGVLAADPTVQRWRDGFERQQGTIDREEAVHDG